MTGGTVADVPAFPSRVDRPYPCGGSYRDDRPGMTLRDYFAGQALANPAICTGDAPQHELVRWFGRYVSGITRAQIAARQASEYADAMLAARATSKEAQGNG